MKKTAEPQRTKSRRARPRSLSESRVDHAGQSRRLRQSRRSEESVRLQSRPKPTRARRARGAEGMGPVIFGCVALLGLIFGLMWSLMTAGAMETEAEKALMAAERQYQELQQMKEKLRTAEADSFVVSELRTDES
ncbi:MAG: hypothetical protein MH204_01360 [Fimbriimonadaceae bacterium]|nr:hypothetical protein [Fimbriimonadaceae bacterium]